MNEEVITDLYNVIYRGLTEISDLMKRYNDQMSASHKLMSMQQEQIIQLKKRVEELESYIKASSNKILT